MQIQTLSIVVPTKRCVNDCKFCVSKMADDRQYINQIEGNTRFFDLYEKDYMRRLEFARDNGCNTVILTGDGEPLQNKTFLKQFAHWNSMLRNPFQWIEFQTSGVMLNEEALRFLRNTVGVTTVSVSVSDLFDNANNNAIIGTPPNYKINLEELCAEIKRYDFNLRISLNLLDNSDSYECTAIMNKVITLGADQVIFRVMYTSEDDGLPESVWVSKHRADNSTVADINRFITARGTALEVLPFGATRYDLMGVSTVLDNSCMPQETTDVFRYLVLRSNCKLYSRWDRKASLIF